MSVLYAMARDRSPQGKVRTFVLDQFTCMAHISFEIFIAPFVLQTCALLGQLWVTGGYLQIYRVGQKSKPQTFVHIFAKY